MPKCIPAPFLNRLTYWCCCSLGAAGTWEQWAYQTGTSTLHNRSCKWIYLIENSFVMVLIILLHWCALYLLSDLKIWSILAFPLLFYGILCVFIDVALFLNTNVLGNMVKHVYNGFCISKGPFITTSTQLIVGFLSSFCVWSLNELLKLYLFCETVFTVE
jgi:hypothetical protein